MNKSNLTFAQCGLVVAVASLISNRAAFGLHRLSRWFKQAILGTVCNQNTFIGGQLQPETIVRIYTRALLFGKVKRLFEAVVELLHEIGEHDAGRTTHAHFAVDKTAGALLPRLMYELVGAVKLLQQVGLVHVLHANVQVLERVGKKVVHIAAHVQYVRDVVAEQRVVVGRVPLGAQVQAGQDL